MSAIVFVAPLVQHTPGRMGHSVRTFVPDPYAVFFEDDIIAVATVGVVTAPQGPIGTLATAVAPGAVATSSTPAGSAVTIGQTAVAGAPAMVYFIQVTYVAGAGNESVASVEFPAYVPFGFVPSVTVAAANAPTGATGFNVYANASIPGSEILQVANTAVGATASLAFPLANHTGVVASATNPVANIAGLAIHASSSNFAGSFGGFGFDSSKQLGATFFSPLTPNNEPLMVQVLDLNGVNIEISLIQPYSDALINTAVGITKDPATGLYVADASATNKIFTILGRSGGLAVAVIGQTGGPGDTGVRVVGKFNSGLI